MGMTSFLYNVMSGEKKKCMPLEKSGDIKIRYGQGRFFCEKKGGFFVSNNVLFPRNEKFASG